MTDALKRLAAANIQLLPATEITTHFLLARGSFAALVERLEDGGFGAIGSPGLLTESGFAVLVWRRGEPWFVSKSRQFRARNEQVADLRRFANDLEAALR